MRWVVESDRARGGWANPIEVARERLKKTLLAGRRFQPGDGRTSRPQDCVRKAFSKRALELSSRNFLTFRNF